jgi:hypothetical protein
VVAAQGPCRSRRGLLAAARREIHEECELADPKLVCDLGLYTRLGFRRGLPDHKTITLFLFQLP